MWFGVRNENFLDRFQHLSEVRIFKEILKGLNKEDMTWAHTRSTRLQIIRKVHISEIGFKTRLTSMVKSKLLIRIGRGLYKVNDVDITFTEIPK